MVYHTSPSLNYGAFSIGKRLWQYYWCQSDSSAMHKCPDSLAVLKNCLSCHFSNTAKVSRHFSSVSSVLVCKCLYTSRKFPVVSGLFWSTIYSYTVLPMLCVSLMLLLMFANSIKALLVFSTRCNIYISRLCYVSVRLSVTEVHWGIIANLGFKFRSKFTAHCGRGEG